MYKEKGFTFIELLVVLSVIGTVLGIGITILSSTLRSSTKATLSNTVKQAGDFATERMVRSIRNAIDVCLSGNQIDIYGSKVVTCPPSFQPIERLRCEVGVGNNNGGLYRTDIAGGGAETRLTSNVKVNACNFSWSCSGGTCSVPKRVTLDFTLKQDALILDSADTKVEIPFKTEVTLRNF